MTTANPWNLGQLVALPYAPPQIVGLAAAVGCAGVGIRLLPTTAGGLYYPLVEDAAMLRETLAALADTGVGIFDLEVLRINEHFDVAAYAGFLEVGEQLGAKHILVAGDDPNASRMTASFAALCEAAARHKLTCDVEFMPWTDVPDVAAAVRIVRGAAQPNGGVLVDALHFARCGSSLEEIRALDPRWVHYAQICDGPVPGPDTTEGLIHAARCERMLPGEGDLPLRALFDALPRGTPVSIEVPSESRAPAMGYENWARLAVAETNKVLGAPFP
ncbi:Xylose isomerase-like TIM barrel [Variovorax sp. PBS-H4]|uniref:sugar phosphate isomerase/epimerase family protein n=1 Tax=Variovorax sp. PBS-H4 TaxID=434008 RepID=UPI001316F375|nr:sugar phosphate isomerase/epimerase [Variovorax sp. PBS-H4]VTU36441.1 Xylose isomerase-like TIM barrel [Variovorax sp. PBS-H4]